MSRAARVDAHQHFWNLAERRGSWPPPELTAIHRDFGPADLEPHRRQAGIDGTVAVQSMPNENDTRYLLHLAAENPFIWGVVGWVDMKATGAAEHIAELAAAHPKLRGFRPMLQDLPDDDWIADARVDAAARAMAEQNLVFDALVLTRHLEALETFVARHPRLQIVLDHGAKPPIATGETGPWLQHIARLAAFPNVACKLSGLLTEAGDTPTEAALRPCVQVLWQHFGSDRLLWGSDWPVLRLAGGYGQWHAMSHSLLRAIDPSITPSALDAVFGGNAMRIYGLASPPIH